MPVTTPTPAVPDYHPGETEPKIRENLGKLTVDDRKLAVNTAVLPVQGKPLGAMGVP